LGGVMDHRLPWFVSALCTFRAYFKGVPIRSMARWFLLAQTLTQPIKEAEEKLVEYQQS
jgi:hypothetical protein